MPSEKICRMVLAACNCSTILGTNRSTCEFGNISMTTCQISRTDEQVVELWDVFRRFSVRATHYLDKSPPLNTHFNFTDGISI